MFYEYAYAQADQLEDIQMDLFNRTGIAWNEDLAQDSDIEAEESEDMEVENSSETVLRQCILQLHGPFQGHYILPKGILESYTQKIITRRMKHENALQKFTSLKISHSEYIKFLLF